VRLNYRIAVCALIALVSGCATLPKNHFLAPDGRTVAGGREVQVSVAQGEIKTNINKSHVAAAMGGGLLGALIDVGVEQHRATVAETEVAPLRNALIGFDYDTEVRSQTKETLTSLDWFGAQTFGFAKEVSPASRRNEVLQANTNQIAFVDYDYGVSVAFDAIELHSRISLANTHDPETLKGKTARASELPYQQRHKVIVPLQGASTDMDANVQRWSANNGALAKQALEASLQHIQVMMKQGLNQSAEDAGKIPSNQKVTAGSYTGTLIEKTDSATLLWNSVTDEWIMVMAPIG
jgi:hypothetical protein